jgi:hypothetical protein
VSVTGEDAAQPETSDPAPHPGDRLITARALDAPRWPTRRGADRGRGGAHACRTAPTSAARDWMTPPLPPYFTREAMALLVARGVRHLLTDLPSVDRLLDEGRLAATACSSACRRTAPPRQRSAARRRPSPR